MKAEGRVFKFGDNVDTDVIIPARYLEFFRSSRACYSLYGGYQ